MPALRSDNQFLLAGAWRMAEISGGKSFRDTAGPESHLSWKSFNLDHWSESLVKANSL